MTLAWSTSGPCKERKCCKYLQFWVQLFLRNWFFIILNNTQNFFFIENREESYFKFKYFNDTCYQHMLPLFYLSAWLCSKITLVTSHTLQRWEAADVREFFWHHQSFNDAVNLELLMADRLDGCVVLDTTYVVLHTACSI